MKRDFSYSYYLEMYSLVILGAFFFTGCSFKTIVHPYPQEFDEFERISFKDNIVLHKDGKLKYIPDRNKPDTTIDLNYKEGSLYVDNGRFYHFKKVDEFTNPETKSTFKIISEAYFDDQKKEDVFRVLLTKKNDSSTLYELSGTSRSSTAIRSDSAAFRIIAQKMWAPSVKKVKSNERTEWHHYPLGGTWDYIDNSDHRYILVQGSPVKKRLGVKANYGQSFTLLSETELSDAFKSEFINIFLGYWSLTTLQYYYEECNLEHLSSEACPGSVIIK